MLSTPHFKRDDADDTLLATTLAEDRPFADSGSSLTSLIEYIQRQAPSYSTTSSEQQPFLPNSNSPSAHEMESYEPLASTMGGQGGGGTGSGLTTSTITMTARSANGLLMVLLPLLIVLSTLLFLLLSFLIFVLILRKKQGIRLTDEGGPVDLSNGDGVHGEGGIAGVEARWVEGQEVEVRQGYRRAKDWQLQYPPSSVPTDITLSQYLSIQEKGVSAWSFEPDYESNPSVYVQSRTEITFLADGPGMPPEEGGGNNVMCNLPLPKLNEVYYWEAKIYEKADGTDVSVGLATKPFPSFRLPGWSKYSIAYHSDGFKSHNYPFTASSYGPPLAQGDVLGVGYRPRTGTVFFTRNGRKHEDAFVGLQRFNLFPVVGANGAATVHVNLGQAGFVFIEANVKKWGLAPSVGTLAPPPAYGSERGSILLEAGFGANGTRSTEAGGREEGATTTGGSPIPHRNGGSGGGRDVAGSHISASSIASSSRSGSGLTSNNPSASRNKHRSRRPNPPSASTTPIVPSPLRVGVPAASPSSPSRSRQTSSSSTAFTSDSLAPHTDDDTSTPYISPSDRDAAPHITHRPPSPSSISSHSDSPSSSRSSSPVNNGSGSSHTNLLRKLSTSPSDEHILNNLATPGNLDISLHSLHPSASAAVQTFGGRGDTSPSRSHSRHRSSGSTSNYSDHRLSIASNSSEDTIRPPPSSHRHSRDLSGASTNAAAAAAEGGGHVREVSPPHYSPLDPVVYADGVPTNLPAAMISAAFEAAEQPPIQSSSSTSAGEEGSNSRRRGGPLGWLFANQNGESNNSSPA